MTDIRPRCSHHVVFPDANCPECMRAEIERLRALLAEARETLYPPMTTGMAGLVERIDAALRSE